MLSFLCHKGKYLNIQNKKERILGSVYLFILSWSVMLLYAKTCSESKVFLIQTKLILPFYILFTSNNILSPSICHILASKGFFSFSCLSFLLKATTFVDPSSPVSCMCLFQVRQFTPFACLIILYSYIHTRARVCDRITSKQVMLLTGCFETLSFWYCESVIHVVCNT